MLNRICIWLALCVAVQAQNSLQILAKDPAGLAVPARVEMVGSHLTNRLTFVTGPEGTGRAGNLAADLYRVTVSASGFEPATFELSIAEGDRLEREVRLEIARAGASVVVRTLPGNLDGVPGSTAVLNKTDLDLMRPYSVKEALRQVTGVHIVDEDSFGLNLNIGIRGLDPRRTQRTLLLEDGAPVHLGPYSDPSAHYHTPPELIQSVEVLKGSGQIAYGPQTVGGVLNFVTEQPPAERLRGTFGATLGDRSFRGAQAKLGTGGDRGGILGHFIYREGDGTRERHAHRIFHGGLSGLVKIRQRQTLLLKGGYYEEESKFAEGGLSQADFERRPFGNPFSNDRFYLERYNAQALHGVDFNDHWRLSTNFYYQKIDRASYRQADFAGDEMTANASNGCTGAARTDYANFADLCGNKMRPRNYEFFGIEPRQDFRGTVFGLRNETSVGVRYHREWVTRRRFNGLTPDARETSPGVLFRDWSENRANAFSGYVQSRWLSKYWTFTPGVRVERIRTVNLALRRGNAVRDARLEGVQTLALPGIGVTFLGLPSTTVFAGVHRGFAPPRPDDNYDPLDPNVIPVSAERSTNYEAGFRTYPGGGLQVEATVFRIDFSNQIVAGETVGLPQLTWANAGRTLHAGFELGTRYNVDRRLLPEGHDVFANVAYTRVAVARFSGSLVTDGIDVIGNRLPYAPGNTLSPSLNYSHRTSGVALSFTLNHIGPQFADSLNRIAPTADGQNGRIPAVTILNAALNVPVRKKGPVLFVSGSNLTDRVYIASRVDGIQVGRPRQVFGGIRWEF